MTVPSPAAARRNYDERRDNPAVVRTRIVEMDSSVLVPGEPVELPLFEDLDLPPVVFDLPEKASGVSTNRIWHGRIAGTPEGEVRIVEGADGVFVAEIRIPETGNLYEIRPVADGDPQHILLEIDETQAPPCGGVVTPPDDGE